MEIDGWPNLKSVWIFPWLCQINRWSMMDVDIQLGNWLVVWKNEFYFPFHIWDVIRNPLTKSHIFQDGYCTNNQVNYSDFSDLTLTSRRDRTLESWLGFGELSQYLVFFQVIELVQFAQNCKHCTNTNIYIYIL